MEEFGFDHEKIDRYFKGAYSDQDESYVNEVFVDKNAEKELKRSLSKQFTAMLTEDDPDSRDLDHILYRIHYEINTKFPAGKVKLFDSLMRWTLRIAGVIMLPLVIFIGIRTYKENTLKKEAWVEIKAPAWTRAQFSLPDGTTGWLNSNSSVKYNGNFITNRQVVLTGEAFFDVFKDNGRPFSVSTKEINVEVLGTRFNIASYEDENNVEVVLEEGKLVFSDNEMHNSYTMNPNDLVIYNKNLMNFSTEIIQPQKYLSWTEGKLVFRNDPLDVIIRRLQRWYNIDIEVDGKLTEGISLRATFIEESLEEVLDLLKLSLPIEYKIKSGELKKDEIYAKKKVLITLKTR